MTARGFTLNPAQVCILGSLDARQRRGLMPDELRTLIELRRIGIAQNNGVGPGARWWLTPAGKDCVAMLTKLERL